VIGRSSHSKVVHVLLHIQPLPARTLICEWKAGFISAIFFSLFLLIDLLTTCGFHAGLNRQHLHTYIHTYTHTYLLTLIAPFHDAGDDELSAHGSLSSIHCAFGSLGIVFHGSPNCTQAERLTGRRFFYSRDAMRLSVRPSLCLSRSGIVSKRLRRNSLITF